ncbi:hypothetical protein [Xanthomonas theicola]|uniref:Secreted protein n=1 Tax=Xanthomonas theicola TaxID=56464 RepID=A0A2S6ZAJ9_9XANT|nr:hypothetical protein [Xanthomonas theicola]PPT79413.1 hypothetical protein XthCFBP4691_18825 [Xanthomonas theicola]QNH25917.1 hypothetical protein G4Q83_15745 [Xanthomonas theicola]
MQSTIPARAFASAFGLCLCACAALAADPVPELQRQPGTAQAVGVVHTIRQIPEACVRFEGIYTGDAAQPYRLSAVRSSPTCQPRAKLVEFDQARPSEAAGWKFNDLIRVPSAGCPTQQAVVRVWRKPADGKPALDGQGQSRIYLEEAKRQAIAGKIAQVPMYAVQMQVEGKACR